MSAHAVPAGRHERHGLSTVVVSVRHFLLWLLPVDPGAPDRWHTVWCAAGDLVAEFFSLLATVVLGALSASAVLVTLLILWWLDWKLAVAAVAVAGLVVAWWRLLRALRRLERAVDEEAPR